MSEDRRPELSPRELECLEGHAKGLTYEQIGDVLGIGRGTVNGHLVDARRKLGARTSAHAAYLFMRREYARQGDPE